MLYTQILSRENLSSRMTITSHLSYKEKLGARDFGCKKEMYYTVQEVDNKSTDQMSLVVRKPVFGVSDQVRHKQGCTVTEDS